MLFPSGLLNIRSFVKYSTNTATKEICHLIRNKYTCPLYVYMVNPIFILYFNITLKLLNCNTLVPGGFHPLLVRAFD